ncbi:hypothetical protein QRX60_16940 [Amycolatopsis mongoliensis]|uniref:Uncharacterized protein n=1 Tax=Amycolatopsis mongoliensis TaxID=715475 RepID=A0A9Y2NPD3_9PSEU|nr:hypothetical protein [Amycolatopsis sp. 4-36]WIY05445.1 hypothetical protein QRX60_16940 [Amycolatopsis sp. 4-36]
MGDFVYRTASDFALHTRHFSRRGGVETMDGDAVAICSGIPADEIARRIAAGTGAVITEEELRRGWARTDAVRVKLGRNPTVYDVLREFGDESTEAGLLGGAA